MEIHVNGAGPTVVFINFESIVRLIFSNIIAKELLNIDYARKVRGSICIMTKIRVVYKLGKNSE